MSTADYMWQCHGCHWENVYDICPACVNCGHAYCGYCVVYINPVKNAPNPQSTMMWTCCICHHDNRSSAGGVCWNCDHYRDGNCTQYWARAQG